MNLTTQCLSDQLGDVNHAQKESSDHPSGPRPFITSQPVRELIGNVLGPGCFAVGGILFNKTQQSNWKVVWHQDLTIAVRERRDVNGFGPWTVKAGVLHVQPSTEVMHRILAIRLHLDASGPDSGPLRVIPGSHKGGAAFD